MKISEVMTRGIEGIQTSDTIENAATRMKDLEIGALAVFKNGSAVGMITDRDIAIRVVGQHLSPSQTKVEQAMTQHPAMCDENCDLSDAVDVMKKCKVRRVLVKNSNNNITGIITIDDIALRGGSQYVADVIKEVKQRIGPKR